MVKQVIVVNKDLKMSPGKFGAQVSHASMAFLTKKIQKHAVENNLQDLNDLGSYDYEATLIFDKEIFEEWISGIFTKVILEVKNENQLLKLIEKAKELGFKEGEDFFIIRDACLTELTPDETGTRITCIGFKPMSEERINQLTKRLRLYSSWE